MLSSLHSSRHYILHDERDKPYYFQIKELLKKEEESEKIIYPPRSEIFKAFDLTPWDEVKVVILGQDPYHGLGQAMGLSFSVPNTIPLPPSLRNIYKELHQEGFENYQLGSSLIHNRKISGDLTRRAEQGVLLLNSILTVRAGEPASHSKIGRQTFTDEVIRQIAVKKTGVVFLLWGNYAISKASLINEEKHLILKGVHPSPLSASRGWFGCNHFRLCNDYLLSVGQSPIHR